MPDALPLALADRLLAARWDHAAVTTPDDLRTLIDEVRAAGMCGARLTRSGGLSALEHRICIEPTAHLGYHQDTAATFWPQEVASLEAAGRRLLAERDAARAEAERLANDRLDDEVGEQGRTAENAELKASVKRLTEELGRAERGLDRWCEWQDQAFAVGGPELLERLEELEQTAPPCRHEPIVAELRAFAHRVAGLDGSIVDEAVAILARLDPARADR